MSTEKFSLQITCYVDGTYAVAVIHQTWDKGAVRRHKPIWKVHTNRQDLEVWVLELLDFDIEQELAAKARTGAGEPLEHRAAASRQVR